MVELPESLNSLSHRVIGCAIEVHRELGVGLLESVYEAALCYELEQQGVGVARQISFSGEYKGRPLPLQRIDLLIEDQIVVELKAVRGVEDAHLAQLVSYLLLMRKPLGLLINFNAPTIQKGLHRRINSKAIQRS
ncbi:MAG: GxxExxY protein [Phycisphaerales bacterium]